MDDIEEEYRRNLAEAMELSEEISMSDIDIDTQAQIILTLFNESQKKTPYGMLMVINEDDLPGGLEGSEKALDKLKDEGYNIAVPTGQRDMSKENGHPTMKGRYLQMLAVPGQKVWDK